VKDAIEVVCRKLEKYDGWFTCVKPSMDKIVSQKGNCVAMSDYCLFLVLYCSRPSLHCFGGILLPDY